jgi:hypothetical protein
MSKQSQTLNARKAAYSVESLRKQKENFKRNHLKKKQESSGTKHTNPIDIWLYSRKPD